MRISLIASVLLFAACSDAPVQNQNDSATFDSVAVMKDTTLRKPQSNILDTVSLKNSVGVLQKDQSKIGEAMMKNTPEGFVIMDTMTGDLNRDSYLDMLIVLEYDSTNLATDLPRPVLILTGNKDGSFKLAARNDNVALCKDCGGVFGDPYDGLAIKNGYFSVQHYGGSAWRWSKIITFKYSEKEHTWLLHRDGGDSYNIHDGEEIEPVETLVNQDQYGKMKFADYSNAQ